MSQTQPQTKGKTMKHFTLLYDHDIAMSGWYTSERAFLAAIKKRHFATDAGYREWVETGSFEIQCDE